MRRLYNFASLKKFFQYLRKVVKVKREKRIFKFFFDDLLYGEEVTVIAESIEEAIRTVLETLGKRLATAMRDITDELDDEGYEAYIRDGEKMIEET